MKDTFDLPKTWKDCPDVGSEGSFKISCPVCPQVNELERSLFISGSEYAREGLTSMGIQKYYVSKNRAIIAYILSFIIAVIVVFIVLDPDKEYIRGMTFIVGLPVLYVSRFLLRELLSVQVGVWKYNCTNCGHELAILSNSKIAAFSGIKPKEPDEVKILPIQIYCPNCREELELEETERYSKQFTCPNCNKFVDLN